MNVSRRTLLRSAALGVGAASCSGLMRTLAAADSPERRRSCILLYMNGGPSQLDTFDPKPGHENGGPFRAIETATSGIRIGEHLPQVAMWTDSMAIVRSLTSKEADHGRAMYLVRTGRLQDAVVQYPTMGSFLSNELGTMATSLPNFVSIAPFRTPNLAAFASGFLGPSRAPFIIGDVSQSTSQRPDAEAYKQLLQVPDLEPVARVAEARLAARRELMRKLDDRFASGRTDPPVLSRRETYQRAVKLMQPEAARAFDLDEEKAPLRDAYGRTLFGQGCLLARRLVERGVPFVEVALGGVNNGGMGWDTHVNNFKTVESLCGVLDPAWSTLMTDLRDRGLLDSTLVVWMGEFGRTPHINGTAGRDHYPLAFSGVLSGGGIQGGQVVGKTGDDGVAVEDRPCSIPEFLATICQALGINPHKTNPSPVGRPIHLVDYDAQPLDGVVL